MLTLQAQGIDAVQLVLAKIQAGAGNRDALDEAAALLLARIRARFLTQTAPDGTKWPESAAAKRRRLMGRGGGTLYDTGTLFHSIQVFAISPDEREIGTDVPYAVKHQLGLGQVQREFMGVNDEDVALATQLVVHRLVKAVEGA